MSPTLLLLLFTTTSQIYGLPPNLLSSLCYVESKHKINAIHKDDGSSNSVGICQVKLKTARWLGFQGTEQQLMDPKININYSAKYLKYQLSRYQSNLAKGITAYNRGNAKGLTRSRYSDKVLSKWRHNNERKTCGSNSCE